MDREDLLIKLWNLSERIRSHGGVLPGDSMLERYKFFAENSSYGTSCVYARKAKDLFLQYDYEDIKRQLIEVVELIKKLGI